MPTAHTHPYPQTLFAPHAEGPRHTFIIAEAGVNHNGDINLAKALIDAAAQAQADAVKFQLFYPETLTTQASPLAVYQSAVLADNLPQSQYELLESLALPEKAYEDLQAYAAQKGILFLCSPFDERSADVLHRQLKLPLLKIPSGEITNLPFLRMLARLNTPVILSTGMSTLKEVETAVQVFRQGSRAPLALLHCVSAYPTPVEAVNLKAIQTLAEAFPECAIGFSDHTLGIHIAVAAVTMGATIIEKHFTLDKNLPGPDHQASLTVAELQDMVRTIRDIEQALGDGIKAPHPVEMDCLGAARKSIVLSRDLPAGHMLCPADIVYKRPGTGLPPAMASQLVGRRLAKPTSKETLLAWEMLELESDG